MYLLITNAVSSGPSLPSFDKLSVKFVNPETSVNITTLLKDCLAGNSLILNNHKFCTIHAKRNIKLLMQEHIPSMKLHFFFALSKIKFTIENRHLIKVNYKQINQSSASKLSFLYLSEIVFKFYFYSNESYWGYISFFYSSLSNSGLTISSSLFGSIDSAALIKFSF